MLRRQFLRSSLLGTSSFAIDLPSLFKAKNNNSSHTSKLKIKKIRYYAAPGYTKPLFNQARGIVEIETDGGIIGIGAVSYTHLDVYKRQTQY